MSQTTSDTSHHEPIHAVEIEQVWIPADGERLAASIDRPGGVEPPWPVVVMVHGFTGNRIGRSYYFVEFGRHLAGKGMACLRFDQTACGESTGSQLDYSLSSVGRDLKCVYDWLRADGRFVVDGGLGLVGSSFGALGTLMLDAEVGTQAMVLWGPVYDLPAQIHNRMGEADVAGLMQEFGCIPYRGMRLGPGYMQNAALIDPDQALSEGQCPILIMHSTHDDVIEVDESYRYVESCKRIDRPCRVVELDDSAHEFFEEPVRTQVLKNSVAWFMKNLR